MAAVFAACSTGALVLQTTVLHALPLIPDLTLILCVYAALHHRSALGACGAFLLGYSLDSCSGAPVGVNAFAMSLVFAVVAAVSRYLWVSNPIAVVAMICLGVVLKTGAFLLLTAVGELSEAARVMVARYVVWDVAAAVLFTPAVFALLHRSEQATQRA